MLGHRFLQQHSCLSYPCQRLCSAFSHQRPAEMLTDKKGCPQCLSTSVSYVRCSAFLNVLLRLLQTYKVLMLKGASETPPRTPLWHIDHFWAGGLENQQTQEGLSDLPFTTQKQVIKFRWEGCPPWTRKIKMFLLMLQRTCTSHLLKWTESSFRLPPHISQSLSHNLLPPIQASLSPPYHSSFFI